MDDAITIRAGTVITGDYLPWARALATSFAEHHDDVAFTVAIAGEFDAAWLRDNDPFEVIPAAELGLADIEYRWMEVIYDGFELCCALKPWLMRALLADADAVIYLDSDILVCDSLAACARRAAQGAILACPHLLEPPPADGLFPDEDTILKSGQLNGGFVAVGHRAQPFLEWWAQRLARECRAWREEEPQRFVDQRWLDLALHYFDVEALRDRGANVAYWNLATRGLRREGDSYRVDGESLRFFHFSGFDPDAPHVLSKHLGEPPRIHPADNPALASLCDAYCQRLARAGYEPGWAASPAPPSARAIDVTPPVRHALRAALVEAEASDPAGVPDPRDDDALIAWLGAPTASPGLSRYLHALHASRAQFRATFPSVPGEDEPHYLEWAAAEGVAKGLVPEVLAPRHAPAADVTGTDQRPVPRLAAMSALGAPSDQVVEAVLAFAASGCDEHLAVAVWPEAVTRLAERITAEAQRRGIALDADIALVQCADDGDLKALLDRADRHIDSGRPGLSSAAAEPVTSTPADARPTISGRLRRFTTALPHERESLLAFAQFAAAQLAPGSRLLDVGAGDGPYRELFAHVSYESTDWEHSVHPGARRADHVGPAHSIPVPDAGYDAVLCTQVLEHLPNPQAVLAELHRILRPGGRLYLTVPLAWELHELPFDFYRYTPHGLRTLLNNAGFARCDIRPRNDCFSTLAQLLENAGTTMGRYPDGCDERRAEAASVLADMAKTVASFGDLDARRIFPLGYSVIADRQTGPEIRPRVSARESVGLSEARRFITLAFAADVFTEPSLLRAYAERFGGDDDATLVIYMPHSDHTAGAGLAALVDGLGLNGADSPDMVALAYAQQAPDESALAASVDAVLSLQPPWGAFAAVPWTHTGTLDDLYAAACAFEAADCLLEPFSTAAI